MGKIKQGILGGFSGKVGTVVGFYWKGRSVMRALAGHVTNPRTPAQEAQRARFGLVARIAGIVRPVLDSTGFRLEAEAAAVTMPNVFVKSNLATAVSGTGTLVQIDWQHLVVSHGDLLGLKNPSAAPASTGHAVELEWDNNSGDSSQASDSDKICIALVNDTKGEIQYDLSTFTRSNEAGTLAYPATWAGDTVHVYGWARTTVLRGTDAAFSNSVRIADIVAA